jgi:hypothetical protein
MSSSPVESANEDASDEGSTGDLLRSAAVEAGTWIGVMLLQFLILAILGVIAVVLFIHVDILVGLIFGGIALGIWMWKTGWVFW